jgi:ribonuclease D
LKQIIMNDRLTIGVRLRTLGVTRNCILLSTCAGGSTRQFAIADSSGPCYRSIPTQADVPRNDGAFGIRQAAPIACRWPRDTLETRQMTIRFHQNDLSDADLARYSGSVAIDTETMGLLPHRDRLCVVQLSPGDGSADVVKIGIGQTRATNLELLLTDPAIVKIFHYARFDLGILHKTFGIDVAPVYCTKIASKLTRTYTDRHGLKDLLRDLLGVEISKQQQSSDWGAETLTDAQLAYAASDVLHLHELRAKLDVVLAREGRSDVAAACFAYLPTKAKLDLMGWLETDILDHS